MLVRVVLQTFVIYLFLMFALGRLGRPVLSELSPFTYVSVALLGSAVESGLYTGSSSLMAGIVSAATLLLANRLLAEGMERSSRFRRALVPVPVMVVRHGEPIKASMRRAGLSMDELKAAVRQRGYDDLREVRFALVEVNGDLGVVPYETDGG